MVPLANKITPSNARFVIKANKFMIVNEIALWGFADFVGKVGGCLASCFFIFTYVVFPCFAMRFMIKLAGVVRRQRESDYKQTLTDYVAKYQELTNDW